MPKEALGEFLRAAQQRADILERSERVYGGSGGPFDDDFDPFRLWDRMNNTAGFEASSERRVGNEDTVTRRPPIGRPSCFLVRGAPAKKVWKEHEKNGQTFSDSASALGLHVNHWRYDQQAKKAYNSIGEEGNLSKNSPRLEINTEHKKAHK